MDIILLIIGLLLCLIGIVGSFLPIIPGPVTSWLGILLLNLTSVVEFNLNFVLITLTVAISVGILDYLIPVLGVKKLGGTRSGQIGTTLGLIIALIILGPKDAVARLEDFIAKYIDIDANKTKAPVFVYQFSVVKTVYQCLLNQLTVRASLAFEISSTHSQLLLIL